MTPAQSESLTPKLTAHDRKILRKVSPWWDEKTDKPGGSVDAWRLGLELRDPDVPGILQVLRGLEQMGLVSHTMTGGWHRGYPVWYRTQAGDEEIK